MSVGFFLKLSMECGEEPRHADAQRSALADDVCVAAEGELPGGPADALVQEKQDGHHRDQRVGVVIGVVAPAVELVLINGGVPRPHRIQVTGDVDASGQPAGEIGDRRVRR